MLYTYIYTYIIHIYIHIYICILYNYIYYIDRQIIHIFRNNTTLLNLLEIFPEAIHVIS